MYKQVHCCATYMLQYIQFITYIQLNGRKNKKTRKVTGKADLMRQVSWFTLISSFLLFQRFLVFLAFHLTSARCESLSASSSGEVWAKLSWRMHSSCYSFPWLQLNSFPHSRWLMLCKLTQNSRFWGIESLLSHSRFAEVPPTTLRDENLILCP